MHSPRIFLSELLRVIQVTQLARDVLGQNVCCWGGHYICKLPRHEADIACHQDGAQHRPSSHDVAWCGVARCMTAGGARLVLGVHADAADDRVARARRLSAPSRGG